MGKPGLSPGEYVQRIQDCPHIADEWPFSHIQTPEHYHKDTRHRRPMLGDIIADTEPGPAFITAAVGRAYTDANVVYVQPIHPTSSPYAAKKQYELELTIDEGTADAWNLMRGITLAIKVTVSGRLQKGVPMRHGTLDRIFGIEQPLRTPDRNGYVPVMSGDRSKGYVHGTVLEDAAPSTYRHTRLRLGREKSPVTLISDGSWVQCAPNTPKQETLKAGDVIRVSARRHPTDQRAYYDDDSKIYLLGRQ